MLLVFDYIRRYRCPIRRYFIAPTGYTSTALCDFETSILKTSSGSPLVFENYPRYDVCHLATL